MERCPSISVVIPTYNAQRYLKSCLDSVFRQNFPSHLLEVIIVDGLSTDRTVKIAKEYDVKVIQNPLREAEIGKMIGFRETHNDLFIYLDADIELAGNEWFEKMVSPLVGDSQIVASFTRFLPRKSDPPLNRYLAYHNLMLDPVLRFFSNSIESTFVENRSEYKICIFQQDKVPLAGVQLYRRDRVERVIGKTENRWLDIEIPVRLSEEGYSKFAYVESAGLYHRTVDGLSDLLRKKRWMIYESFLPTQSVRRFRYIKLDSLKDFLKLLGWICYANLIFLTAFNAMVQSFRKRDLACMYQPIISAVLTDYYVYLLMRRRSGRDFVFKLTRQLIRLFYAGSDKGI